MRDDYPWGSHRLDIIDSRVPAKKNTEHHGLEKLAAQYHITAQYDYAYHHWLIAASAPCVRIVDIKIRAVSRLPPI